MAGNNPGARDKCRRLLTGTHLIGTDTAKLAGVLKFLRDLPQDDRSLLLELGSSRWVLTQAMEDIMCAISQKVDVPAVGGGTQTLEFLSVFKTWDYILENRVQGYANLLLSLPRSCGSVRAT